MTIPGLPGVMIEGKEKSLDPQHRAVLVKPFRLRILIFAVPLILASVGGTSVFLINQVDVQEKLEIEAEKEGPMTFDKLQRENRISPFPLAIGSRWKYKGEGELSEDRRVISSHLAPTAEPQFEYTVTDPIASWRKLLRATNEGILLLEKIDLEGNQFIFTPPLMIVPRPIYLESHWEYKGVISKGDEGEEWDLTYTVEGQESITTPVGTFTTLRVVVSGYKGETLIEERVWYALGTGPIQTQKNLGQRITKFTLSELSRSRK